MTLATLGGCDQSSTSGTSTDPGTSSDPDASAGSARPTWIATTGHINDALKRITEGCDIELILFCGPGVDPHGFSPAMSDVRAMETADAIFYNGFHLEAKLIDLLDGRYADKSWAMASGFPPEARLDWVENGTVDPDAPFDPHIWNHLSGWSKCVAGLIDEVCRIDPDNEDRFRENGQRYIDEITAMDKTAAARFAQLPKPSRVLVSAHDAFNYFAKVYDFETIAIVGIGNDAEADIRTMREVATGVVDKKVPVIFVESITNPRLTDALREACLARDWPVKIADKPLYSDDLGSGPPIDTFLGAFEHNVDLITQSLQPRQ